MMEMLHPTENAQEKLDELLRQVKKAKKTNPKTHLTKDLSDNCRVKPLSFSSILACTWNFRIILSSARDGAILEEFIIPGNSTGTLTRAQRKVLIRQGFVASPELTLPGDAKEAQKKQAELSHAG